ncbi:MAG: YeeE/YedE family protein [Methylococcales bacterium]|nr:YeeE/YedE family protein [Methylococcales bacterium]MCK5924264.1 YeeE/YedE family protein [Methylococcales bacterium]
MKVNLMSLLSGLIFGIGLAFSQMINPDKVLNFLDVTGNWDPSLALVMGGALSITTTCFYFIIKRKTPILEQKFRLPTRTDIDKSLIIGAMLFGIGWGMAGFCPGPAIASLGMDLLDPFIFVGAMLAGAWLQGFVFKKR